MDPLLLDKLEAMDLQGNGQSRSNRGLLDLPLDLMHEVMGPLDARSLLEVAKSHKLLHERVGDWTGKKWEVVHLSYRHAVIDNFHFFFHDDDVLLKNASVTIVECDLTTKIAPAMTVRTVEFSGKVRDAHKCAELIKLWGPSEVLCMGWWTPEESAAGLELRNALKDVGGIFFRKAAVEWLSYIPEWKLKECRITIVTGGINVTEKVKTVLQKLFEQWKSGQRDKFMVYIYTDAAIDPYEIDGYCHPYGQRDVLSRGDEMLLELLIYPQLSYMGCFFCADGDDPW